MKFVLKMLFILSLVLCIVIPAYAVSEIGYTIEDGRLVLEKMTGDRISVLFVKASAGQDELKIDNSFVKLTNANNEELRFPLLCSEVDVDSLAADYSLTVTNDGKTIIKETVAYIPKQNLDAFVSAMAQKSESEIKTDLQKYAASLGMPAGASANDEKYLTEISGIIKQRSAEITTFEEFRKIDTVYTKRQNFLTELKATVLWSQIPALVEKYSDIFADSTINSYGNKVSSAYSSFVGASYTNVETFEAEYLASVKKAPEAGSSLPGGSGGSGGGGGGFSPRPADDEDEVSKKPLPETSVPVQKSIFADMSEAEWAIEAVEALAQSGAINGVDGKNFEPNNHITREAFVKILCVAFEIEETEETSGFSDVDNEEWYAPFVAAAKKAGIVMGSGDKFGTGENITRQDAAVLLARIADIKGMSLKNGAADFIDKAEIADYAIDAIGKLKASGVINGMEDGGFYPNQNMTRAEGAKLIYGLLTIKEVQ